MYNALISMQFNETNVLDSTETHFQAVPHPDSVQTGIPQWLAYLLKEPCLFFALIVVPLCLISTQLFTFGCIAPNITSLGVVYIMFYLWV